MLVSFEQKCELRKRTGIAGICDTITNKLNRPFQPDVPDFDIHKDSQSRVYFKTLKHPFIRDKLHLWVNDLLHTKEDKSVNLKKNLYARVILIYKTNI